MLRARLVCARLARGCSRDASLSPPHKLLNRVFRAHRFPRQPQLLMQMTERDYITAPVECLENASPAAVQSCYK